MSNELLETELFWKGRGEDMRQITIVLSSLAALLSVAVIVLSAVGLAKDKARY